jgi:hypothetical protein
VLGLMRENCLGDGVVVGPACSNFLRNGRKQIVFFWAELVEAVFEWDVERGPMWVNVAQSIFVMEVMEAIGSMTLSYVQLVFAFSMFARFRS